jgi:hypothetical protein
MKTPSNNYKPFMAYILPADYVRLRKLSVKTKIPMSQLVREGITSRLAKGNPHIAGFNEGMTKAVEIVNGLSSAEMRFPSGKSFGELVAEAVLAQMIVEEKNENPDRPT